MADTAEPKFDRLASLWGRRAFRLLLGLSFIVLVGCNSFGLFLRHHLGVKTDPEKVVQAPAGAPSKYQIYVPPYVFLSDFELKRDAPLFEELAGLRDQVYRELKLPPSNAIVQVYLFPDRERYDRFMQARYPELPRRRAFFIANPRPLGGGDDLLVYTFWGERIQQDLRHELTHALLHSVLKDVPLWLDEGLAEYFELPPDRLGVNRNHLDHLRFGTNNSGPFKPNLARLEMLREVHQMTPAEYRESWAWVHLMLRGRPEARAVLLSYLNHLRDSAHPPLLGPKLTAVLPNLDQALLDHLSRLESRPR